MFRLGIYVLFALALGAVGTWAQAVDAEGEAVELVEHPNDEPWSGKLIKSVFDVLDVDVCVFEYKNPGSHELQLHWRLYTDHNEESVTEFGLIAPIELDEPTLSIAAVIHEGEDDLTVKVMGPEGSTAETTKKGLSPDLSGTYAQSLRRSIPLNEETPIYAYARTNNTEISGQQGRSASQIIARYEWVIIVYATITPMGAKE